MKGEEGIKRPSRNLVHTPSLHPHLHSKVQGFISVLGHAGTACLHSLGLAFHLTCPQVNTWCLDLTTAG